MASYRGHLTFSTALGAAYGGLAWWQFGIDWPPAALGGALAAVAGLLPDLDSDSGVPVRELFGLAAATAPFLLLRRLQAQGFSTEQMILVLGSGYAIIRYGLSALFKRLTVHRGMFHSLPAMCIAGLLVFLAYHNPAMKIRLYLAAGCMLGFLSHLVLDELCSVDISGAALKLNKYAGSALKFWSMSTVATLTTYGMLAGLSYLALMDLEGRSGTWRELQRRTLRIGAQPVQSQRR